MTREEALKELAICIDSTDIEVAHATADRVLAELLIDLGYQDVVEAWEKVDKWYA